MKNLNFTRDLSKYGDLIPIDKFKEYVKCGAIMDDDGTGHWVKDNKMTDGFGDNVCSIWQLDKAKDEGITHVMWFTK